MSPDVKAALMAALDARVLESRPVTGGDINEAWAARLSDGRIVFVKENRRASPAMFPAEARGLDWLRSAGALAVPEVLAVSSGAAEEPAFLALEYLAPSAPNPGYDEALGRGIAALHRSGAPSFGLEHDNFIGRLQQDNHIEAKWATFYLRRRLLPQVALAERSGRARAGLRRDVEHLGDRLNELVGPDEPPARLHGDLWGGNVHVSAGRPWLIDPATYGGHREVDIAMMRLFGGFSERTFAAYTEAYPLPPGHEERTGLYQLYPLLVHLNLFGGHYAGSVDAVLGRFA
jgi:fructosamine-3-kinase